MKKLRILDSSGDTEFAFGNGEAAADQAAREAFDQAMRAGSAVFAVNRGGGQPDKRVRSFEALESENVVVRALAGG